MEVPVTRVYDHKGNLLEEVRREFEFSMEAKKAIARYVCKLIKESEEEEA